MNWVLLLAGTGFVLAAGGAIISKFDEIGADPTIEKDPDPVDSVQVLANFATWLGGLMLIAAMVLSYAYF